MMKNYSSPPSRFHYPFHNYQHFSLENLKKIPSVSNPNFNSIPGPINNITQNDILLQSQTNKHSEDKGTLKKITKITFFSSSSLHNHNHDDDDGKLKNHTCDVCNKVFSSHNGLKGHTRWHTQMGSKKGNTHPLAATTTLFEQSHDDKFLPTIDCSKYLPPISYNTKKRQPQRRRRYMNIDDDAIAAETLLHISRGGFEGSTANIDVNHCGAKRQKLSCSISDIDETLKDNSHNEKKLVLRFKIPKEKIFETSQDCKEPADNDIEEKKKINEGETKLGSKVVKNFDLNELPSDDLEDESK